MCFVSISCFVASYIYKVSIEKKFTHSFRAAKLRLLNFLSLFRDLQEPTRFSGGGVVAEFFRHLQLQNQIFTQH